MIKHTIRQPKVAAPQQGLDFFLEHNDEQEVTLYGEDPKGTVWTIATLRHVGVLELATDLPDDLVGVQIETGGYIKTTKDGGAV